MAESDGLEKRESLSNKTTYGGDRQPDLELLTTVHDCGTRLGRRQLTAKIRTNIRTLGRLGQGLASAPIKHSFVRNYTHGVDDVPNSSGVYWDAFRPFGGPPERSVDLVWPTRLVKSSTALVYLDLNHWIGLSDAAVGRSQGNAYRDASDLAERPKATAERSSRFRPPTTWKSPRSSTLRGARI